MSFSSEAKYCWDMEWIKSHVSFILERNNCSKTWWFYPLEFCITRAKVTDELVMVKRHSFVTASWFELLELKPIKSHQTCIVLLPLWHATTIPDFCTDQTRLETLYNRKVMMPNPQDPERFSFWVQFLLPLYSCGRFSYFLII